MTAKNLPRLFLSLALIPFLARISVAQTASPFYLGADISTLAQVQQRGGIYMDNNQPADPLSIFMNHGWTCFRLRIWVNPGTLQNLKDNLRETITHYHKDVMVVETGYPARTRRLTDAQAKNMTWPMTPQSQRQFLADVIAAVKNAPESYGIGVNYWHPESTYMGGATTRPNNDVNSLFDAKGNALPAMNVLNWMATPVQ
jgi:arabinogalactan endo-1,4-beta-galactosidase